MTTEQQKDIDLLNDFYKDGLAVKRKEKFKKWLTKKYDKSTVDDYINGLKQIWDQSLLKEEEKRESPFKFGEKEIDALNELKSEFEREWKEKSGKELDEVGEKGLDSYIEYLNSLNKNKKSKESDGDEDDDRMDEDEEDDEGDDNMDEPKNIILYGPPGTGKTYSTVERAVKIIRGEDFVNDIRRKYPDNEKEVYNQLKEEYKKQVEGNHIKFVTFHQSYGYEDFIEGIKPVLTEEDKASSGQSAQNQSAGTQVSYRIEDGVFKEFCKNADPSCVGEADEKEQETSKQLSIDDTSPENENNGEQKAPEESNDKRPYVFIIDEINRGNISKIFGELITLIEETKRKGKDEATSTILPYSKKRFYVPEDVYIIGTMNTADRSIAVVDTALRRRFTFEEMMPDSSKLAGINIDGIDIPELLDVMNCRITALYDREHTIGHSFFMPLKDNPSMTLLGKIFKTKIIPLLQEYFFEDYEKIRLVLGDNQKEKGEPQFILENVKKSHDLFGKFDVLDEDAKIYKINDGKIDGAKYDQSNDAFINPEAYRFLQDKSGSSGVPSGGSSTDGGSLAGGAEEQQDTGTNGGQGKAAETPDE